MNLNYKTLLSNLENELLIDATTEYKESENVNPENSDEVIFTMSITGDLSHNKKVVFQDGFPNEDNKELVRAIFLGEIIFNKQ